MYFYICILLIHIFNIKVGLKPPHSSLMPSKKNQSRNNIPNPQHFWRRWIRLLWNYPIWAFPLVFKLVHSSGHIVQGGRREYGPQEGKGKGCGFFLISAFFLKNQMPASLSLTWREQNLENFWSSPDCNSRWDAMTVLKYWLGSSRRSGMQAAG